MAPIPRCDLRLPDDPGVRRPLPTTAPTAEREAPAPSKPSKRPSGASGRPSWVEAPLHEQRSQTRDSAEILEGADEFSTGVTRDSAEVRDHRLHESGADEPPAGADQSPDPCATLAQYRAEAAAEEAAAAAAVSDEEDVVTPSTVAPSTAAPAVEVAATPGDVCAHFCEERPESAYSGCDFKQTVASDKLAATFGGPRRKVRKPPKQCKGRYAPVEAYAGLWGGQRAWRARQKLELEMRTKRRQYERLQERERRRRERERRRCQEKSRMMRCRDQAKITEAVDNINVNKAFYLRFNYNMQLPYMPSAMSEHLRRFKKPPFKFFPKGSRACRRAVDEFAKLRVTEAEKGGAGLTTPAPAVKALTASSRTVRTKA